MDARSQAAPASNANCQTWPPAQTLQNWAVNVICGTIEVPTTQFGLGVFFGMMPNNYLTCKAGVLLKQMTNDSKIVDSSTYFWLMLIALGGLVGPTLYSKLADGGLGY